MISALKAHPSVWPHAPGLFKQTFSGKLMLKGSRNLRLNFPYPSNSKCSAKKQISSVSAASRKQDFLRSATADVTSGYLPAEEDEPRRSLAEQFWSYLKEQTDQLKYIEWPSFKDTLKTATLTLALVVAFIIFVSSVDSCLSFLLESFLRRTG